MVLYLLHYRGDEEISDLFDHIVDNYFEEGKINELGKIELRLIETQGFDLEYIKKIANKIRDNFKGIRGGIISTLPTVVYKLKLFKEQYDYPDDILIKASENYIKQQRESNFQYIQRVDRFILMEEDGVPVSKLAAFCEDIINDKGEEETWDETI